MRGNPLAPWRLDNRREPINPSPLGWFVTSASTVFFQEIILGCRGSESHLDESFLSHPHLTSVGKAKVVPAQKIGVICFRTKVENSSSFATNVSPIKNYRRAVRNRTFLVHVQLEAKPDGPRHSCEQEQGIEAIDLGRGFAKPKRAS